MVMSDAGREVVRHAGEGQFDLLARARAERVMSLWPAAPAIVATGIAAAAPRPALAGAGVIALGLGAAAVLIIVLAALHP